MENIVKKLNFKGKWRNYQEKVLNQLSYHFADKKLHVVAAPGAGKTILGIEVIRQLGNPALVLSPTIVIKNQWKERILQNFLPDDIDNTCISSNLIEVKSITSGTYQRLHAVKKKNLLDELIAELKKNNVKTLVLDEAHHLRTEWYRTLDELIEKLSEDIPDFRIVSLTATPPYDVEEKEWNNYYGLCGPIDAEISIPELVQNNNLCPHQDLIFFSDLDEQERKIVFNFKQNRDKFFEYINKNTDLMYSVEASTFLEDYENNFDLIYEDTDFTVALISYLFSLDETHVKATYLMNFLELKKEQIPEFDYKIAEDLFNGILGKFKKYFKNIPTLKSKIKEFGLLKNASKVDFEGETDFKKLFARSQNKLKSIEKITDAEYSVLGENLREVILLDYIGKDSGAYGLNIMSAFKLLNKTKNKKLKLAVLTGTIVLIDKSQKELLDKLIAERNLVGKILTTDYDENYLRVESYGEVDTVALITEFFSQGGANVLIGTHSLLGEGWDSPCINTLIIGSVIASFMLSNQMRGRALRIDKNNPEKTANIWHLLAIESELDKGFDFNIISRRFDTFDGISYTKTGIESGLARLGFKDEDYKSENLDVLNQISLELALAREDLPQKWKKSLKGGKILPQKTGQVFQGLSISDTQTETVRFKKIIKLNKNRNDFNGLIKLFLNPTIISLVFCIFLIIAYCQNDEYIDFPIGIFWGITFGPILWALIGSFFIDDFEQTERLRDKKDFYIKAIKKITPSKYTKLFLSALGVSLMTTLWLNEKAWVFIILTLIFGTILAIPSKETKKKIDPTLEKTWYFMILPIILFAIIVSILMSFYTEFYTANLLHFGVGLGICLLPIIYPIVMLFKAYVIIPIKEKLYSWLYKLKFNLSVYPTYVYIADALLKTLCRMGEIKTPYDVLEIKYENGILNLGNAQLKEQNKFRGIMQELFGQHKNEPKYILKLRQQKDKNIIPPYVLKRDDAEFFAQELSKRFGKVEVVGTRTLMGKRELLKARYNDFIQAQAKNKRTWGI